MTRVRVKKSIFLIFVYFKTENIDVKYLNQLGVI